VKRLVEFAKAGHWPTLLAAFLYFDVSFCVWCLLGPLGTFIAEDLALTATEKGLLVATPLLGGSIFRVVMGGLADHLGPRRAGLLGIGLTFVPLVLGWLVADSLWRLLLVAVLLGVPGASFAVALPLVSRWYPPHYQGLAMGIAGAGNSGTVLAALLVPRLAEAFGWRAAIGLAAVPMAIAGVVFLLCARDSPTRPPPRRLRDYAGLLGQLDTFWFCLFYGITFGGFVGLASFLGLFFRDQYGLDRVAAGDLTALCVLAGSFMRPVGGLLADRRGGLRVLMLLYGAAGVLLLGVGSLPPLWLATALFVVALAILGAGNGCVFQLVPLRFQREIGTITGLVGAAGGLGGFFLPSLLGAFKDSTGTYSTGLYAYALVCLWGMTLLLAVSAGWRLTWAGDGGRVGAVGAAEGAWRSGPPSAIPTSAAR
jgi:NNP family nitrate/nitrite transporter-like MFS transporter